MSGLDPGALDRYITGGRYSSERLWVTCSCCEEHVAVFAETEYGSTTWTPGECKHCGTSFTGLEDTEPDEPPDPEPDDFDDRGRFEPWI